MPDFYQWQGERLILNIRAQPRASKDEFSEVMDDRIKLRITAPPVDGKANQHIIRWIASCFGVSRSQVEILNGETGRNKRIAIDSPRKLPEFIQSAE